MAVKLRLARVGKKHAPFYRIVAVDERAPRDGAALEILGTYNPLKGEIIQFHEERVNYWIGCGAQQSNAVKLIAKKYKERAQVAA